MVPKHAALRSGRVSKGAIDEYHVRQYEEPYRSTVAFAEWLEGLGVLAADRARRVIDLGCGGGANVCYLARRHPDCQFLGVDIDVRLVRWGNARLRDEKVRNARLTVGNLYEFAKKSRRAPDGVLSLQTLSWLPRYEPALRAMIELRPRFLALSSLFYDGGIECRIEVRDYTGDGGGARRSFYNVLPLPQVRHFLAKRGYRNFAAKAFEIDVDLPAPAGPGLGTYTEKLADGRRLQISGPLLMSWYFVFASRDGLSAR
jgi:SAM-dependent methyltransferase